VQAKPLLFINLLLKNDINYYICAYSIFLFFKLSLKIYKNIINLFMY